MLIRQHSFHNPDDPCTHISPILNLVFFVVAAAVAVAVAWAVAVGMWGAVVAVRGAVVVVKAAAACRPAENSVAARSALFSSASDLSCQKFHPVLLDS